MNAYDEVLERCRSVRTPIRLWVMRVFGAPGVCMVIDLGQTELRPGSKFERQDKRIAVGPDWETVLANMPNSTTLGDTT